MNEIFEKYVETMRHRMRSTSDYADNQNRLLWLLLAFALGSRILVATYWYEPVSQAYFEQARAILDGGWEGLWPNGLPLIIALCMWLFGAGADVAMLALNVAMSTAIVGLVFALARERTDNAYLALLAALLAAAWPTQLTYVRFLQTEVPATFFLCLGIFLVCRQRNIGGGLALGMASIIRPSLLPIALLLAGLFLFRRQYARVVVLLCASLALPAGTSAYSHYVSGDSNLFYVPMYVSGDSQASENLARTIFYGRMSLDDASEYHRTTAFEALTLLAQDFADDPMSFVQRRIENLWELWGPWPDRLQGRGGKGPRHWFWTLVLGLHFPLLLLALAGLGRKPDLYGIVLFVPALVLTGIHVLIFAIPRYAVPAEPFLFVLAAPLAGYAWLWWQKR